MRSLKPHILIFRRYLSSYGNNIHPEAFQIHVSLVFFYMLMERTSECQRDSDRNTSKRANL